MHTFYTPNIQSDEFFLSEEESKHCVRVLRLKEQDTVYLIDGVGGFYNALITEANQKKCKVVVNQKIKEFGKRNYQLTIAIAPTKNIERFEWFLEKATEIGIDRIIPIISFQSERRQIKPERLNKILIEATKQSKQAYLPVLENICNFKDLMQRPFDGKKLIAYCSEDKRPYVNDLVSIGENVVILIGPEGDFSTDEINLALEIGYKGISLGNTRLRTETAGIAACHSISGLNQISIQK
jgi:16S rRNA (uracil1498-N3)-methyltransferase